MSEDKDELRSDSADVERSFHTLTCGSEEEVQYNSDVVVVNRSDHSIEDPSSLASESFLGYNPANFVLSPALPPRVVGNPVIQNLLDPSTYNSLSHSPKHKQDAMEYDDLVLVPKYDPLEALMLSRIAQSRSQERSHKSRRSDSDQLTCGEGSTKLHRHITCVIRPQPPQKKNEVSQLPESSQDLTTPLVDQKRVEMYDCDSPEVEVIDKIKKEPANNQPHHLSNQAPEHQHRLKS